MDVLRLFGPKKHKPKIYTNAPSVREKAKRWEGHHADLRAGTDRLIHTSSSSDRPDKNPAALAGQLDSAYPPLNQDLPWVFSLVAHDRFE